MRAGGVGVSARLSFVLFLVPLFALAQEFEVATIKPSPPGAQGPTSAGLHLDGAQVTYTALDLKLYLGMAFRLRNYQISAPDWMTSGRWDISAKLPSGADPKQIPEMLQALLRDRFRMKMHRETRDLPVYALILGKGELKMKTSAVDPTVGEQSIGVAATPSGTGTIIRYNNGASMVIGNNKFEGRKLTTAIMADALARFADRPVIDLTGLKDTYDFTMEFSPEDFRAMMIRAAIAQGSPVSPELIRLADSAPGDTIFNAVEKLGLKLEPRKAPIEMLIIDDASKTPTEN